MMPDMDSWRDKDDLELSAQDLADMMEAGEKVELVGPPDHLAAGAEIVHVPTSFGSKTATFGRVTTAKTYASA